MAASFKPEQIGALLDIATIRQQVQSRRYQIKIHAVQHALKEGFSEKEMIQAIMSGRVIETYPDENRVLICGQAVLESEITFYLHIVCEQNYPDQVEFVTAYIPDERLWERPPFKRRSKRK